MSNGTSPWELFAAQSEFFWRFQQMVALVEVGVFSGWYTLFVGDKKFLAAALLVFGSFILFNPISHHQTRIPISKRVARACTQGSSRDR